MESLSSSPSSPMSLESSANQNQSMILINDPFAIDTYEKQELTWLQIKRVRTRHFRFTLLLHSHLINFVPQGRTRNVIKDGRSSGAQFSRLYIFESFLQFHFGVRPPSTGRRQSGLGPAEDARVTVCFATFFKLSYSHVFDPTGSLHPTESQSLPTNKKCASPSASAVRIGQTQNVCLRVEFFREFLLFRFPIISCDSFWRQRRGSCLLCANIFFYLFRFERDALRTGKSARFF